MSTKNRKPETKQQAIIKLWEQTGKLSAGAAELDSIQQELLVHRGPDVSESPASIARILADHDVRLGHPEVLEADVRWRERRQLFTAEELNFGTLDGATALVEKMEQLWRGFQGQTSALEHLRFSVRQIKAELELLAAKQNAGDRELAQEVVQWLTIWLQNPQIFSEWLALRRSTVEFRERFEQ